MLISRTILLIFVTVLTVSSGVSQGSTDLYLFRLKKTDDQAYHLYHAEFLSSFNPGGYTNQPWFTREGNLLVSVRKAGEKQNDIYQLSPITKSIRRMTKTPSNEYSPRIHPDGQQLTVLRQVEGDSINQQVYKVPLKGGRYISMTPEIRNTGYYTCIAANHIALFRIIGESNTLEYMNLDDRRTRRIASAVGRSLWTDPAGNIVYVHKFATEYWYLKKYNPVTATIDIIAETPGLTEDFAVAPDGTYFMSAGSKVYSLQPSREKTWHVVMDLAIYGIHEITRIAINHDGTQMALVSTKDK
jgi:WD40 repeat protein